MRVRSSNRGYAGECRSEYEKRRARQVEVGEQPVDDPETKSRSDEKRRLRRAGADPRRRRGGLQRAQRRRTDRNDGTPGRARRGDRRGSRIGNVEALAVHAMLREILGFDRLEGARADVQRQSREGHAVRPQSIEHRSVEMEARSGRSDGPRVAGVDRLVALAVGGSRCTPDVRRQRHLAMPFEVDVERRVRVEAKPNETPIALLHDRTRASIEEEPAARLGRMTGRELHPRFVGRDDPLEQQLDPASGLAPTVQPRTDHLRVVEHDEITRREQPGQVRESAIGDSRARDVHQAAFGTLRSRCLRDQLRRQVVIEIGQAEAGAFGHGAG